MLAIVLSFIAGVYFVPVILVAHEITCYSTEIRREIEREGAAKMLGAAVLNFVACPLIVLQKMTK